VEVDAILPVTIPAFMVAKGEAEDVCGALMATNPHAVSVPLGDVCSQLVFRRFTPRECERLQGFPDDYTKFGVNSKGKVVKISEVKRYEMIGNAVTTTVAAWLGKQIMEVINNESEN
jgi:DNA (cytosine-5)-methyltransferase 1